MEIKSIAKCNVCGYSCEEYKTRCCVYCGRVICPKCKKTNAKHRICEDCKEMIK